MAYTTDGGETWSFRDSSSARNFLSATYMGGTRLYIGNDSGKVIYSNDGGTTWNEINSYNYPINAICFTQTAYLYYYGHIVTPDIDYQTNDSGNNWEEIALPFVTTWGSWALAGGISPAGEVSFIVGSYSSHLGLLPWILRKTVNDTEWVMYTPPLQSGELYDVSVPSPQVAYACGTEGTIYKTVNGGNSWETNLQGRSPDLNAIYFHNEFEGFSVGDSGTIIYTNNGGATKIEKDINIYVNDFILNQNYPNPFNPVTKIRFSLPENQQVKLTVYTITGERIATLVSGFLDGGQHRIEWNGANQAGTPVASGIYLYELKAGNERLVKKMLLTR